MSKILIIDAMKKFAHSNGELNLTLHHAAADFLREAGHEVKETIVDQGYVIEDEIEKYLWADSVIYQQPGWWMGMPWILKKYIDDVFTAGHGRLYSSDGRTRFDASKKYGSGGLIQGKTYMLSVTWNAPQEAFDDPKQFFGGAGIDGVYLPFHKANQFLGMSPLPTFLCTDVMKNPDVEHNIQRLRQHLAKVFG
ncbi:MAG: NAD(P)H-dependent oxidoreductase [Enterobacteriaceae bacterium]|jgi:modulator of drug activity B|nr:NAD(P)H-dependent oxidoreductase [Enterobacteriaceae bacterium]